MNSFLQEYGLIIVAVLVALVMIAFVSGSYGKGIATAINDAVKKLFEKGASVTPPDPTTLP